MNLEVVAPGMLSTVQDAVGRRRWRHLGVPVGGAADPWSARLANRLVGNADEEAMLEMTLDGATLRLTDAATIAFTGGLTASVDGLPLPARHARVVRTGSLVRIGAGTGARGYLAVAGGIDVAVVLGSRSTELRGGFGGHEGRSLRAGDRLPIGSPVGAAVRWTGAEPASEGPIRVMAGPHPAALDALLAGRFTVSAQADRIGARLKESVGTGGDAPSMGLPLGAVQLPPDGRPIVMLADRPVTGGYLVPAVVIRADVGRVAQLRPGDGMHFVPVGLEEARAARRRADEELAALEPLDAVEDDELGWSGSHR